ncbi:acyltransferase ChoActase/COT/CPT [Syncephalis pseudoplumigaleata]|uniref:Acyltransferase ChoActase/COT/CPT n=1 Tax=Syncephalis pseudoplumigaleata TaxID=1712513 RepID=A0A4V1J200_9FUNG|nr:acyltransferase ChoActase/COT/CPT [Syncephalis pseudoplumigaleata]|eukprot:RKP26829.1 acyltransferase ChoActase/COT/CPT [Syncephalis pseudoplumigaleata]
MDEHRPSTVWSVSLCPRRDVDDPCAYRDHSRHARPYGTAAEAPAAPRTFELQSKLPRLPIPSLEETSQRYLRSLVPLLTPEEYRRSEAAVQEFIKPHGLGEELQHRLQQLEQTSPHSWLEDIWLNKAYLEWREPSMINVNWWAQFTDGPSGLFHPAPPRGEFTAFQIRRAASFTSGLLDINDQLNNQTYTVEMARDRPMCMHQYQCQFGGARIAEHPADRITTVYPALARHIVVLVRDQVFKVPVIAENGKRVPVQLLEKQLAAVVKMAREDDAQPPVGLLTAGHRDRWADARARLSSLSDSNRRTLDAIDTALFAICLDDRPASLNYDEAHKELFHGGNARNRWFDKPMQIIIANNGRGGVNGEHTPADAVTPGMFFEAILKAEPSRDPANVDTTAPLASPEHLTWTVDSSVRDAIGEAEKEAAKLIGGIDSVILHYQEYGYEYLKQARTSPDALVQMALQLAFYRQHGRPCPTYESASTRLFLHGRTETVRSCSVDSLAFTRGFDDPSVVAQEKRALLKRALDAHVAYMKAASSGKGVDRHLLGLRCQIRDADEQAHATLFTDPAYVASMSFELSTSNMSPGDYFWGGFGAVVKHGYGINYAIGRRHVKFSMSAWNESDATDVQAMRGQISRAMTDIGQLLQQQ